jgi:hypothetical protein
MESPLLAGLVAAVPLAIILALYTLARGRALAAFFQGQDESMAKVSESSLFWIILAGFIGMAFVFGALSGLVYGWLGMPRFQYLAIGAVLLFSLLAVVSRQPLPVDKIIWNLAVGGVLGMLVPVLAG